MSIGIVKTIDSDYSEWLQGLISGDERFGRRYGKLLKALEAKEFTYFIPNDDNRAEDGKKLRILFLNAQRRRDDVRTNLSLLQEPCSLLEMLIGLAKRFDMLIANDPDGSIEEWFCEFLDNLGLGTATDVRFDERRVDRILEIFLARTYERTGKGGIFPIKNPRGRDMRNVELWYQMMAYLDENYEI